MTASFNSEKLFFFFFKKVETLANFESHPTSSGWFWNFAGKTFKSGCNRGLFRRPNLERNPAHCSETRGVPGCARTWQSDRFDH